MENFIIFDIIMIILRFHYSTSFILIIHLVNTYFNRHCLQYIFLV